jgi:hypothetical protein
MRKIHQFVLELRNANPDDCGNEQCLHRQYFIGRRMGEGRYDLIQNTRCYGELTHAYMDGAWVRRRIYGWRNHMATPTQREILEELCLMLDDEEYRLRSEIVQRTQQANTAAVSWGNLIDPARPTMDELNALFSSTASVATWNWTA